MHLCFDILSWIFPLFVPAPSLLLSLMFCWFEGVIAFTSWVHMRQEESEWPVWLCVLFLCGAFTLWRSNRSACLVNTSASLGGFRPLIHDLHLLWPYHFWLDKVATHTHQVQMSRVPWQYIIQEQQQLESLKLLGGSGADLRLRGSGWRNLDTSWKHTQWWSGGNL